MSSLPRSRQTGTTCRFEQINSLCHLQVAAEATVRCAGLQRTYLRRTSPFRNAEFRGSPLRGEERGAAAAFL